MVEGGEHFFLAGIAHPRRIAWPGRIRAAAIGNEGHDVDKAALFDRECEDMGIESQVHLRDIDQVLIDTARPVRRTQLFAVDHPAVGAGTAETRCHQRLAKTVEHMITNGRLDAVCGDQQVAAMLGAVGEQYASLVAILLHADGTLAEPGDAFGQLAGQRVEEVGTVYRRLPYPFSQAGTQITGIFTPTPFEPDVLPRVLGLVGNLAVGFGNTQARDGAHGISAERDTRSDLAKGRRRFE
ncbi:hypothetical protein D3C73_823970 [compost metagenome]